MPLGVVEAELAGAMTQFGVAGMVAWMWLTERRSAAARERQLTELHERLMRERRETDVVVDALRENARALTALEVGQRGLIHLLERVVESRHARGGGSGVSENRGP